MSGPWEDFASQAAPASPESNDQGPWSDFKAPSPATKADNIPTMTIKPEPAGVMERFGEGLADPIHGGAQLLPHMLPDAVVKPVNRFNNWLAEKTGLVAPIPEGGVDEMERQREAGIRRTAPEGTNWARLAGNILSPVNLAIPGGGALEGAGGIAARVGQDAYQGAAAGLLQPATGPGSFFGEKAEQGTVGFMVGGALGAVSEAAKPVVNWLRGIHGDEAVANDKAAKVILDRFEKDKSGGGPTFQDMLDLANLTPDKPIMFADVAGVNVKALLGKIARTPGEAKQILATAMNDRAIDTSVRLGDDITENLGGGAAYTVDKALVKARSEAAKPKFEKAFAVGPIYSARIDQYLHQPEVQEGIRRGWTMERQMAVGQGRPINPHDYAIMYFDKRGHPVIGPVPTMRLLAVAKEGIDAKIEDLTDKETGILTKAGLALKIFLYGDRDNPGLNPGGFVGELDRLNPAYKVARDAWSGGTASFRALREGQNIFRLEPDEIRDLFQNEYTDNDRQFFRLGAANAMRKIIGGTQEEGEQTGLALGMPKGNPANRLAGTPRAQQQMRAMFDSQAQFDKFFRGLNAEHMIYQTWNRTYGGFQTAERMSEDLRGELYAGSHAVRAGSRFAAGHPLEGAAHSLQALTAILPKTHPKVAAAEARLLKSSVPEAVKTLQGATNNVPSMTIRRRLYDAARAGVTSAATPNFGQQQ